MAAEAALDDSTLAAIDEQLRDTDAHLGNDYPGERDARQAVHTVYVPADVYTPDLPAVWGQRALDAVGEHGGMLRLAQRVVEASREEPGLVRPLGVRDDAPDAQEIESLAAAVTQKLREEPIEDLRIDFEDGFGNRPDEEEDSLAIAAAEHVAQTIAQGSSPAFVGIRFKCLEAPVRRRGLRTLDLFVSTLIRAHGGVPEQLVLTLPKVSTVEQIRAMVTACRALERALDLADGSLRFEVQVETPQLILGADGLITIAPALHAGEGRITSLHYGTYDYSASVGVAAAYQAMDHPAADFAKQHMQLAVAGTGVHLSDGSTNLLPVGDAETVNAAWGLHAALIRRHLQSGIYQGWDLHPSQLPTRFLATFLFFREGFGSAARRLRNYVFKESSGVLDEPATAKALARYLARGLACGAVSAQELNEATGVGPADLAHLARTGLLPDHSAHQTEERNSQ